MSLKTLIGTAIISLGIAGIIFVAQNSAPSLNQTDKIESKNNNIVSDKPFVETINNSDPSNPQNSQPSENLTEVFTKGIGQTIKLNNLPGPQDLNGQKVINAPDADAVANNLIQEAAKKFDPSSLRPIIKDSDLKISQDNSQQAIQEYILNFQNILKSEAPKVPKTIYNSNVPENFTIKDITDLSNVYGAVADKFYKLTVPKNALDIHKKEIELSITKKNILEKIKNYQNDPITTILAAQELKKVDQEFAELDKNFSELIKKINS